MPSANHWFRLDPQPGEEHVFVVVAATPLEDPAARVAAVDGRLELSQRPRTVGIGNRAAAGAEPVTADDTVAIYRFWVRREAPPP